MENPPPKTGDSATMYDSESNRLNEEIKFWNSQSSDEGMSDDQIDDHVAALQLELEAVEAARRQVNAVFKKAKSYEPARKALEKEQEEEKAKARIQEIKNEDGETIGHSYRIGRENIGWLDGEIDVPLTLIESADGNFYFANIIGLSKRTQEGIDDGHFTDRQIKRAEGQIIAHTLQRIASGRGNPNGHELALQPLEESTTRNATTLEPFKDRRVTAGRRPNEVGALVLLDSNEETPVYLMAALAQRHGNGEGQPHIYELQ